MTALLEVPAVRERVHRMPVEEYHRAGKTGVLPKGVELLKGIVFRLLVVEVSGDQPGDRRKQG
jgi:hypothetical protein